MFVRRKFPGRWHIVTDDETWIAHITPGSKQQSLQWLHTGSPKPKKFKQTLSARKIMATVFWDRKVILLVDFMTQGTTINSESYCETLTELRRAIQSRWRGLLTSGVCARQRAAAYRRPYTRIIRTFRVGNYRTSPIQFRPCPSDYHLFLHVKNFLGGQSLGSDQETKDVVEDGLKGLAVSF
jgi:hypothetical protein